MRAFHSIAGITAAATLAAGCGSALNLNTHNEVFAIAAAADHATTTQTVALKAERYSGGAADVEWTVRSENPGEDAGRVDDKGVYTPPAYLEHDVLHVQVAAQLANDPNSAATYDLDVYPAVSLAPENVALTPGATTTLYATIAEAGGGALTWSVTRTPGTASLPASYGRFSQPHCRTSGESFTQCSVLFTAPAALAGDNPSLLYAQAALRANPTAYTAARVLLNGSSDATPLDNEALQTGGNAALGTSGGNANDSAGQYCCGGTLGALVHIGGADYILGNNHVLARSDEAAPGEAITQPGLTDTQCGYDPSYTVGELSYAPKLHDAATNVDAAIAKVTPGTVRPDGAVIGLGESASGRSPEAAPPAADPEDITAAGHTLPLIVKSGRSTGLTCAPVAEIAVDLKVAYNAACDGSGDGFTKVFHDQIAIAGAAFSDTGDSGSLLVDQQTAQPVGMMFAGNANETFANPIDDVLRSLEPFAQSHGAAEPALAGGAHHAVTCLDYDALAKPASTPASQLSSAEQARAGQALAAIQAGVTDLHLGNATATITSSRDAPGEAAIVVHVVEGEAVPPLPVSVNGVRTMLDAGQTAAREQNALSTLPRSVVDRAIAVKQRVAAEWLSDPAVLGIGVGKSRDNPLDAAIVVYIAEGSTPRATPAAADGIRIAYRTSDPPRAFHWKQRAEAAPRLCSPRAATASALPELSR